MPVSAPADRREVRQRFEPLPSAARSARAWSDPLLADWGMGERRHDAVLVVSELVGNAIRHGEGSIEVCLSREANVVRIAVSDHGAVAELTAHDPSPDSTGGRGLSIVEHLATAWGVRAVATGGKSVWATLPIRAA